MSQTSKVLHHGFPDDRSYRTSWVFLIEVFAGWESSALGSLPLWLKPRTMVTDFFKSSMRNAMKKELTVELKNRNTTHDSLSGKNQFCLPQLWQFTSIMIATKYGTRERTRNSKMKKEVRANFLSFMVIASRRLPWIAVLLDKVGWFWRETRDCFLKR